MRVNACGLVTGIRYVKSPNEDERPAGERISLIVIHSISLPPGQFGGPGVESLFTNTLDYSQHPYYGQLEGLRVSAHFFIRRNGEIMQFVSCDRRAWHAGLSSWKGQVRCNDFSIGIELEGADDSPFAAPQYDSLALLTNALRRHYPIEDVVGHSDIAPGRKTDPGPAFEWDRLRSPPQAS